MKTNGAAVLLVLCTSLLVLLDASTFGGVALVVNQDGDHCSYEGKLHRANSTFNTDDCFKCHCGDGGHYSCLGVGFLAGVIGYPDGCLLRKDTCYEGEIIQDTSIITVCERVGEKVYSGP